jgi:apolipoprotein N-acyltransferase
VQAGGQVLVVQTNNATYARTGQPEQQLAITKLRARELGRDTLVAATSGISAAITPAGTTTWQAPEMVPAVAVVTVQLRSGSTPAVRFGAWLDRAAVLAGLVAVLSWFGLGMANRRRVGGFEEANRVAQSQGERPDV